MNYEEAWVQQNEARRALEASDFSDWLAGKTEVEIRAYIVSLIAQCGSLTVDWVIVSESRVVTIGWHHDYLKLPSVTTIRPLDEMNARPSVEPDNNGDPTLH